MTPVKPMNVKDAEAFRKLLEPVFTAINIAHESALSLNLENPDDEEAAFHKEGMLAILQETSDDFLSLISYCEHSIDCAEAE